MLGVASYTCHLITKEIEAGLVHIQGQPALHSDFQASLVYRVRPYLDKDHILVTCLIAMTKYICQKQFKYERIIFWRYFILFCFVFGSWFEDLVYHGREVGGRSMRQLLTLHPQSRGKKRRTLVLIVRSLPVGWYHSGFVFTSQLT